MCVPKRHVYHWQVQFLQWRMITPKKKALYTSHPLEDGGKETVREKPAAAAMFSPIRVLGQFQGRVRSDCVSESGQSGSSNESWQEETPNDQRCDHIPYKPAMVHTHFLTYTSQWLILSLTLLVCVHCCLRNQCICDCSRKVFFYKYKILFSAIKEQS